MKNTLKKFEKQAIDAKKQNKIKGGTDNTNPSDLNQGTDFIITTDVVDG